MHIAGTTLLLGLRYRKKKAADPGGCSRAALRVIMAGTPPRTTQRSLSETKWPAAGSHLATGICRSHRDNCFRWCRSEKFACQYHACPVLDGTARL